MCGRFAQAVPLGMLNRIDIFSNLNQQVLQSYNVTPGEMASIILFREQPEIVISRWGFIIRHTKKPGADKLVINARSESCAEKYLFKNSFLYHRCLIPVSGFFEWKHEGAVKNPYFIYPDPSRNNDFSVLFLAGLYTITQDNSLLFTVITRESSKNLRHIHGRMPLCIIPSELYSWLNPQTSEDYLSVMINKCYVSEFGTHRVSGAVNNATDKTENCIKPAE